MLQTTNKLLDHYYTKFIPFMNIKQPTFFTGTCTKSSVSLPICVRVACSDPLATPTKLVGGALLPLYMYIVHVLAFTRRHGAAEHYQRGRIDEQAQQFTVGSPSIMAEGPITVEYVCNVCLSANPSIRDLIDVGCFKPGAHAKAPRVPVRWSHDSRRIERVRSVEFSSDAFFGSLSLPKRDTRSRVDIRPMPRVNVPHQGKRFIMCDFGWRCGGDQCTFAHSMEEREAWNEALLRQQSATTAAPGRRLSYDERIGGKWIKL